MQFTLHTPFPELHFSIISASRRSSGWVFRSTLFRPFLIVAYLLHGMPISSFLITTTKTTTWESSSSSLRVEFVNPFCPETSSRITDNSFSLEQVTSLFQNPQSWRIRVIIRRFLLFGCLPWLTSPHYPSCNSGKGPLACWSCSWTVSWKLQLHTSRERYIWERSSL